MNNPRGENSWEQFSTILTLFYALLRRNLPTALTSREILIGSFRILRFCMNKIHKKCRNLHNYHVIIFYLIYVDHLIENIFRTVSFLTFLTIECCSLFWVTSDSMRWIFSTGIWCRDKYLFPNIPHFCVKNFQPGNFHGICQTENFCASLEKIRNIWE